MVEWTYSEDGDGAAAGWCALEFVQWCVWVAEKGPRKKMKKGKSRLLGEYEGGGWCRAIHIVLQIVLAVRSVPNSSCATPLNHKYPYIFICGVELG